MSVARDQPSLQAHIKQTLRDEIIQGLWRQGDKLPPEPGLMQRFGVSRITVSQALRDLATEGLVIRRQGKGTFVSAHPHGWTNLGALLQRMPLQHSRGEAPAHASSRLTCEQPPAAVALDLQLPAGEKTWCFTRVKTVAGAPAQWEQAYIPAARVTCDPRSLPADHWAGSYFIEILRHWTGLEARRCRAFLQAVELSPEVAAAIGEAPGKPTIEVTRLWHNATGHPVLLTRSVLRPDGTRYYVDLPELPGKGREEP